MTDLHHAAYCNDPDRVHIQLQGGVPVDVRDDNGWTPLHWSIDMAQASGNPEQVVSMLLAAGASPNAIDHQGQSILMVACGRNNLWILNQLLNAGADIHLESSSGTTALHEAAGCNFGEAIRRLLTLGADPSQVDAHDQTPEQEAERCGFDESVELLRSARRARPDDPP